MNVFLTVHQDKHFIKIPNKYFIKNYCRKFLLKKIGICCAMNTEEAKINVDSHLCLEQEFSITPLRLDTNSFQFRDRVFKMKDSLESYQRLLFSVETWSKSNKIFSARDQNTINTVSFARFRCKMSRIKIL